MMKLLRTIMKKMHNRPRADRPDDQPRTLPEGPLGSFDENIKQMKEAFNSCNDVLLRELPPGLVVGGGRTFIAYIESLSPYQAVDRALATFHSLIEKPQRIRPDETTGNAQVLTVETIQDAVAKVLDGWTVCMSDRSASAYAFNTYIPPVRPIDRSETESVMLGPQEAFTESIQSNLGLIRKRLRTPQLKFEFMTIGTYTHTYVAIAYLSGITQQEYIDSIRARLEHVETDGIFDASDLAQRIDDNPVSPFPQYHMTERPERVVSHLLDGKTAVVVDGSPLVLTSPASFIEFFQSSEDYSNRWVSASVIRTLRLVGVLISISLSAVYVAVVTYHYQMIPSDMLITLTESRSRVPFPPVYETLLLEVTIELLREAGARLPTKVGQTIGIVGGIVIGQAAVSAGLTSNILVIAVALSTIASFITPSYIMSTALRAIRFPLIILAGWWGMYGLFLGLLMIMIHFLRLSSLGAPYFSPFAPLRLSDWKDTFLRVPTPWMNYRSTNTRPRETQRQPFEAEITPPATPTSAKWDSGRRSDPDDGQGGDQP